MARILSEEFRNGPYRCVMHCFSSGAVLAQAALDLGFCNSQLAIRHMNEKILTCGCMNEMINEDGGGFSGAKNQDLLHNQRVACKVRKCT
jgi:hypothetical protein